VNCGIITVIISIRPLVFLQGGPKSKPQSSVHILSNIDRFSKIFHWRIL